MLQPLAEYQTTDLHNRRPQILRSIDSDSADGFPSHQAEAMQMGLDSGKGKIIEYSIQKVPFLQSTYRSSLQSHCPPLTP